MWKYFAALVALFALGGIGAAQAPVMPDYCADCYANVINQFDYQAIGDVRLGLSTETDESEVDTVAVGNEGLSAAIIVTPAPAAIDNMFVKAPFARIDQGMAQTISGLGSTDPTMGEGAKGVTWNKAIQAAWIAGEGLKELNETSGVYEKEGVLIRQFTGQRIENIYDYDSREEAKVLNVDNKLAMIVDNLTAVIDIAAKASSDTWDNSSSEGSIINDVSVNVSAKDP